MDKRIKELRNALKLTQQAFADKIGTSRGNIACYEIGKNTPSDAVVSLICKEFNVNEEWLRTGEGEMFKQLSEHPSLDDLAKSYNATETDYQLIRNYLSLDPTVKLQIQSLFSFKE